MLRRTLVVVGVMLAALAAPIGSGPTKTVSAECAFPFTPTTYEDLKNRQLFLDTIELAAFDMLFPGQPYFGLPKLEVGTRGSARKREVGSIPPILLKSIAWIESSLTQAGTDVPFGAIGESLVSFDCGHGIAQVTTGMTTPTGEMGKGSQEQALVASHFAYNIARGAYILADKWNEAPEQKPIAGTDTNGHPQVLENWYFALWSYNGFTGPGANKSNHPLDPIYGTWPRATFSCGPTGDGKGHNRGNYPYQELVLGCAANPPVVDGKKLWDAQAISMPDVTQNQWWEPLRFENFVAPYARMDIPSPQPLHMDTTQPPSASLRDKVLGKPKLDVSRNVVKVGVTPGSGSTVELVDVLNEGTGVMAWYAIPSVPWLNVLPYTGVAVGDNLPCASGAPCERKAHIEISVDASKAPTGSRTAQVTLQELGSGQTVVINVAVMQVVRIGVAGITRN